MKATLFREDAETRANDIQFSVVGPGHMRAYFTLIPIAGYAAVNRLEKHPYFAPPFRIYSMCGEHFEREYKTEASAKQATRSLIKKWLSAAATSVTWIAEDTGVHWTAKANGVQIANYYFCPEAGGKWHKNFRVWFGGTYYTTSFTNPDEARAAVQTSYEIWLFHAKKCLTFTPSTQP